MDLSIFATPVALIAIFYFLVIRPQQKRTKQQRDMLGSLVAGDRIVTYSGIYATVVEPGDPLKVRIADGVVVEIAPPAVASKMSADSGSVDPTEADSGASNAGEDDRNA